jgi:exosortase
VSDLTQTAPSADGPNPVSDAPILLWQAAVLGGLLIWIYSPVLARLAQVWWSNPNFSHGAFVPLFSAYVMWEKRARLAAIPRRPSWTGAVLLALALLVLIVGVMGAELFLSRFSLLLVVAGLVVAFLGWRYQREILFPWAFLLLMIPIPTIVFTQITFPLQLLASRLASLVLPWLGVPVLREGNVIHLPAMALEVAEACSGIRSLLSLITLAIIYGYLLEKRTWPRIVLALAAVPIAVIANSLRIVGTGLLVQYWNPDRAEGFFHSFSGWLIFVVSLCMLFLLHSAMRRHPYQESPE